MTKKNSFFPFRTWMAAAALVAATALFLWHPTLAMGQETPAPTAPSSDVGATPPDKAPGAEGAEPKKEAVGSPSAPAQPSPPATQPAEKPAVTPQPEQKPAEQPAAPPQEPKKETVPDKPAVEEAPKKQESTPAAKESETLSNDSCIECHNKDILKMSKEDLLEQVVVERKPAPQRQKPPFVFGELNLAIDAKKYAKGVHADTTCVSCHTDVSDIPHNQRLKHVDCKECHEEFVENIASSAHGEKSGKRNPECIGCHDVHYGEGKDAYAKDFQRKLCLECHTAYKMDTEKGHARLYEPRLHLALDCMLCHSGKDKGVHNIPLVKTQVANCESCHQKYTILTKEKIKPTDFWTYITQTSFINSDVLKKFGYVIGAHRIPALDTIVILAVLAPLGLPIFHGGLRFITRRKGPIHLPTEKILLHPFIERVWHWVQALCIIVLIITGIMLHWPERFPGWFEWSVTVHNWFGIATVIAFLAWLFYNLTTRRITHYFPKKGEIPVGMIKQAKFYAYGIFKHEPHPYTPSEDNKFNPLQKIAYLQFQVFLLPLLLITGILYMYPETFRGIINAIGGVTVLALIHYVLGALFAAFLMAHLYLATTGETIGENFKAMIFGYGLKADHDEHHEKV